MNIRTCKNKEYGFTLVEVLISLTIFSIAVAGVITVAIQGSSNVNAARNKVEASYLADEGIELMRGMRDTAVVNAVASGGTEDDGWLAFISPAYAGLCATAPCDIDPTNNSGVDPYPSASSISDCSSYPGSMCPLYYIPSTGYYTSVVTMPGLSPSVFKRTIQIDTTLGPNQVRITSKVEWTEGLTNPSVTQTEVLFNWYN